MSRWDSWKDGYDAWKLATPPEYDEPRCHTCGDSGFAGCGSGYGDVCPECGGQSRVDDDTDDREPPQHDAHVDAYYNSLF